MQRGLGLAILPLAALAASCASSEGPASRSLAPRDFVRAAGEAEVAADTQPMRGGSSISDQTDASASASAQAGSGGDSAPEAVQQPPRAITAGASASAGDATAVSAQPARVEEGRTWPVEGLVGQVNGRPLFAEAFFNPIEDRLLAIAANADRAEARRAIVSFVSSAFKQTVDSELIVAEAESQLSPEQQQGLFAWIRSLQEETIAERGGSRAAAEQSLESEGALSLEQFLEERRDEALAGRLLNQRIEPRTIVSWRDIVQEFQQREAEFNPPPAIRIGRIRLNANDDKDAIAKVRALVAEGKTFSQIARELALPEGGFWNRYALPASGIAGLELSDPIKQRLANLQQDQVSEPLEVRDIVSWFAVMEIESQKRRSIYDRDLQIQIENELKNRRRIIERERYIDSLRSRWVTDDIREMEAKLVQIALERYFR